jgi:hypothetical protein
MSPLTVYDSIGRPKGSGGSAIMLDVWHTIGNAGEPAFGTGWGAQAGKSVQFRKDPFGKVMVRGAFRSTLSWAFTPPTNNVLFTLPVGYRPVIDWQFKILTIEPSGANSSALHVVGLVSAADGTVALTGQLGASGPTGASGTYVIVDEIDFDTGSVASLPTGPPGPPGPPGGNSTVLMDTWHSVGAAGEPAFQNGWVNYDNNSAAPGPAPQRNVRFRKYPDGRVALAGLIKASGTNAFQTVFTLPVGYRPTTNASAYNPMFGNSVAYGFTQFTVYPNGNVEIHGTVGYCYLDGIEFDTETVTAIPTGPKGDKGDTGGNATVPIEDWRVVGASGQPAFENGWTNYLNAYAVAAFRKMPDGTVRLRGTVKSGSIATTIFTLPAGYRPANGVLTPAVVNFVGAAYSASGIAIMPDGRVNHQGGSGSNAQCWIDVSFMAEDVPVTQMPTGPIGPQGPPGNSVTVPMDIWHLVGAAGEPAFANANWKNYGSGTTAVGFRKDPLGRVFLKGALGVQTAQIGTGTNIFVLPAGYRPPTNLIFDARTASGASDTNARVDVLADGSVLFQNIGTSGPAPVGILISLDGLFFDTEAVTAMPTGPMGPTGPAGPLVNVLPGGAADGQECFYAADLANGVFWHLKFVQSIGRWVVVGGSPLVAETLAAQGAVTSTTYVNLTPALTLPLVGIYDVTIYSGGAGCEGPAGQTGSISYKIGAAAAVDADACVIRNEAAGSNNWVSISSTRRKTIAVAGTVLQTQAKRDLTGNFYWNGNGAWPYGIRAMPVMIG